MTSMLKLRQACFRSVDKADQEPPNFLEKLVRREIEPSQMAKLSQINDVPVQQRI